MILRNQIFKTLSGPDNEDFPQAEKVESDKKPEDSTNVRDQGFKGQCEDLPLNGEGAGGDHDLQRGLIASHQPQGRVGELNTILDKLGL